ncbi:carbohydrate ABC transporter permease [Paenibacillus roseipurpureus]|uniref:Carbohydrate ABC transporter permease n=1 Tax=Paenibacillus roseopurpureus TaxID=2918901 RepID=A0AA96RLL2_9BACL|nr:carbohydrate ABC transporter permease [Paenibacillus sp. MBLB1832]WNR45544.1 carbohydrate ABC transporter permease [Paenibacillus sp. MBLB1832]
MYAFIQRSALWIFLLVVAIVTVFPVAMALLGSFKTNAEIVGGASLLPQHWIGSNYADAWKQAHFSTFSWNSLFVSTATTIGTLIVTAAAAYAVDRFEFAGKKLYVGLQAATMFIAIGAVVLRPQFQLMVKLHLHTSLWGVILILISAHASIFFILLSFMNGIPKELDQAALMDGCNPFTTFWRIILPLLGPGLGVGALFTFRAAWNEYLLPFVFTMNSPKLQTLTVGLAGLRYGATAAAQTNLIMAGACLSILPLLLVYVLANRSFMQMTAGSLKG